MNNKKKVHCVLCNGSAKLEKVINKKIHKENIFGLNIKGYKREIYKCLRCEHFFNVHRYEKFLNKVYSNSYSKYSYGDIKKKFQYLYELPNNLSTNYSRLKYLNFFLKKKKKIYTQHIRYWIWFRNISLYFKRKRIQNRVY